MSKNKGGRRQEAPMCGFAAILYRLSYSKCVYWVGCVKPDKLYKRNNTKVWHPSESNPEVSGYKIVVPLCVGMPGLGGGAKYKIQKVEG